MTFPRPGELLSGSASYFGRGWLDPVAQLCNLVFKTLVITELEARKLRHDPSQLLTRAVQPALWLLVFGQVFGRLRAMPTGNLPYLDFLTPGVLAQSVLFMAIFSGLAVIWERDLGILHKLLVSPAPRIALVLGKAVAAGLRSLSQGVLIYGLAALLGVNLDWSLPALLGVFVTIFLGAALFSSLSLLVACLVKTHERFMGIGQFLTMPLFFASNAIYPLTLMPDWLQKVAALNPLTYMVDALRSLMLTGEASSYGLALDAVVLVGVTAILAMVCERLYPRLVI